MCEMRKLLQLMHCFGARAFGVTASARDCMSLIAKYRAASMAVVPRIACILLKKTPQLFVWIPGQSEGKAARVAFLSATLAGKPESLVRVIACRDFKAACSTQVVQGI
jgi:hypothetical protein